MKVVPNTKHRTEENFVVPGENMERIVNIKVFFYYPF